MKKDSVILQENISSFETLLDNYSPSKVNPLIKENIYENFSKLKNSIDSVSFLLVKEIKNVEDFKKDYKNLTADNVTDYLNELFFSEYKDDFYHVRIEKVYKLLNNTYRELEKKVQNLSPDLKKKVGEMRLDEATFAGLIKNIPEEDDILNEFMLRPSLDSVLEFFAKCLNNLKTSIPNPGFRKYYRILLVKEYGKKSSLYLMEKGVVQSNFWNKSRTPLNGKNGDYKVLYEEAGGFFKDYFKDDEDLSIILAELQEIYKNVGASIKVLINEDAGYEEVLDW
ncbi:MAG: hypothetical protein JW791_02200 [Nanoarchaeota archaeon]|nr:hypothetical protein [Nanoarchaeota archaeon]